MATANWFLFNLPVSSVSTKVQIDSKSGLLKPDFVKTFKATVESTYPLFWLSQAWKSPS